MSSEHQSSHTGEQQSRHAGNAHTTGSDHHNQHGHNTSMAIISYIPFLFLVPMLTKEDKDPFIKYHIKQGIVFTIAAVLVNAIFSPFLFFFFLFFLRPLAELALLVVFIIGVLHAVNGEMKPLPIIGQFADKIRL